MSYQALYRKWRPAVFEDVVGQNHVTDTIKYQLKTGRLSHAYLFTGTRGTGKTTCAKILARAVNCENPKDGNPCNECKACRGILNGEIMDVLEIDAASNNGVDNIRDIRNEAVFTPVAVKQRVYIIDEVHMLSTGAFNALLKTLEEPPEHVLFILATTEAHKVPATILSRCQRFDFRRITAASICRRLLDVARGENIKIDEDAAMTLSKMADGSMRDALSLLDRCYMTGQTITIDTVRETLGLLGKDEGLNLIGKIAEFDVEGALKKFEECYQNGREISSLFDELLTILRDMMFIKISGKDALVTSPSEDLTKAAETFSQERLISSAKIIQETIYRLSRCANKRVEAEFCIVKLCEGGGNDMDALISRLEKVEKRGTAAAPAREKPRPEERAHTAAYISEAKETEKPAKIETAQEKPAESAVTAEKGISGGKYDTAALLKELSKKLSPSVMTFLGFSNIAISDKNIEIQTNDDMATMIIDKPDVKESIHESAKGLFGVDAPVIVSEVGLKEEQSTLDSFLDGAKALGVDIRVK